MFVNRERETSQFLAALDSDNADIRSRGQHDLAQILKRREPATLRWRADTKFALDLTERLDQAFQKLLKSEAAVGAKIAASTEPNKERFWRELHPERDHVSFLMSALGEFHVPVGASVLCAIARHNQAGDQIGNAYQRRKALVALMNMGDNTRGFAEIPAEYQQRVIDDLKAEANASGESARSGWARTALWYLDKNALPPGVVKGLVKVDETLVYTAAAEDRYLRQLTAVAFTYWDGPQAEATLLKLANDDGRGTLPRDEDNN
jgi:hypothetical protein